MKRVLGICGIVLAALAVASMVPAGQVRLLDESVLAGLRGGQDPPPPPSFEFCDEDATNSYCKCEAHWCSEIGCTVAYYDDGVNPPKRVHAKGTEPPLRHSVKTCFFNWTCEEKCDVTGTESLTGCKMNVWSDSNTCEAEPNETDVPYMQVDCYG